MIHFPCPMHSPGDDLTPFSPQVDEYGIPENPFAPPAETQQPSPRRRRAGRSDGIPSAAPVQQVPMTQQAQPVNPARRVQPVQTGPQFRPPVSPEIPDWLRTAQQNNMPLPNRPQGPRVQAAPRPSQPQDMRPAGQQPLHQRMTAAQGYPPSPYPRPQQQAAYQPQQAQGAPIRRRSPQYEQPVDQQPVYPQQQAAYQPQQAQGAPIRRRSPQYEQPADQQPVYPQQYQQPAPQQEGWYVADDDEEALPREVPAWLKRIPWLGIAAFASVALAVAMWILGLNYQNQLTAVLDARAAQEAQLVENHPLKYEQLIGSMADKYNLSPAYVAAIMLNESSFRPQATAESTGARGLMQLVSPTAEWVHNKLSPGTSFSFDAMYDPATNAEYGCWYLNYLSELFGGDPVLVTAAYHAGQTEVRNWLNTDAYSPDGKTIAIDKIPITATRRYVARVMDAYAAYLRIYYGG